MKNEPTRRSGCGFQPDITNIIMILFIDFSSAHHVSFVGRIALPAPRICEGFNPTFYYAQFFAGFNNGTRPTTTDITDLNMIQFFVNVYTRNNLVLVGWLYRR